jgi:hypothetical protein
MVRPREDIRDAILGLVASWGDRKAPISRLQQNRRGLSMRFSRLLASSELKYYLD